MIALLNELKVIKKTSTKNYIVSDYKNPPEKDVKAYRRKVIYDKDGLKHIITVAILKKKGPKGGRTRITSIWHPKKEFAHKK